MQNTLKQSVGCVGVGLHSGEDIRMSLHPAKENTGITFIRKDIQGFDPVINANYLNVSNTNLGTTISNDEGTLVSTIEHLMAALWGCNVDNAIIEIDGPEVPIMDGSSEPFVFLLECAGLQEQNRKKNVIEVLKNIELVDDNKSVSVAPADEFSVSLEIDFSDSIISKQRAIFNSSSLSFKTDLCRARTFGFEHEAKKLHSMGLAKGASLDNAVVISNGGILNKGGLRYDNEFVRHKILDCIGDFYLAGAVVKGKFTGYRSGHNLNNQLLRKFFADKSAWRYAEI